MSYYCKICDKTVNLTSRYILFKSLTHKSNNESIISRCIIINPYFHDFDVLMNRYIKQQNKQIVEYNILKVLKILTTTNHIRHIRLKPKINLESHFEISKTFLMSSIKKDRYYFPKIYEMRISFICHIRDMTYEFYIKQPKSMCE